MKVNEMMAPPEGSSPPLSGYVTVVIVNYNTRDLLLKCIDSVLETTDLNQTDIIVVDNNSKDASLSALRASFKDVNILSNRKNLGFGAANNQAFGLLETDAVLLLNPDAFLLSGSLEELYLALQRDPDAAVVGPKTLYPDKTIQDSVFSFPTVFGELAEAFQLRNLLVRLLHLSFSSRLWRSLQSDLYVDWLRGSCLLCRTRALREVSGFDEDYFLYSEEVDLQYRLSKAGWKILYCEGAEIVHHHGVSMALAPVTTYVENFRSRMQFAQKHFGQAKILALHSIWVVHNLVRLSLFLPLSSVTRSARHRMLAARYCEATRFLTGQKQA